MVAANIQITQGSGTRLATSSYTEGAVTVHDEKMLLGETYLPTYTIPSSASIATADSHVCQVMAGASLKVRIRRIEIFQSVLATTAALGSWSVFRLTTAGTGGGAVTPAPLDTTDAASGATAMTLPTAKGTETTRIVLAQVYYMQTAGASSTLAQPILVFDFDRPRSKPLIIPTGTTNGIALKNETAVAGASVRFNIWFDETSF